MHSPINILVVRNDKIGDFVLTFPALALLKCSVPHANISVLVPPYTAELAASCKWIDNVIIDPGNKVAITETVQFYKSLKSANFDAVITLFSTTRIGIGVLFAGIPYRLAPATKLAQIFYNHRIKQRRSKSLKPEYEYNRDLIQIFLSHQSISVSNQSGPPYLQFDKDFVSQLRNEFVKTYNIDVNTKLIFVHPGSGGSASNLSLQQYAQLITKLDISDSHTVVLTAGPGEENIVSSLSTILGDTPHIKYISTEGLRRFAEHIQFCDVFISCSTGPLHIAGALNRPTAGFYTRRRSATPLRWQTLNTPDRRLAFTPPETADEMEMSQIDVNAAAKEISEKFLNINENHLSNE